MDRFLQSPVFKDEASAVAAQHKWVCRKRNGKWWVWKPHQPIPFTEFDRFPYHLPVWLHMSGVI